MKKIYFSILFMFIIGWFSSFAQPCGQNITDSRDGKTYKTVAIGTQCWMAENLNLGTKINSTTGGELMKDNGIVEKYCWKDSLDNCDGTGGKMKRGGFYEWKEAVQLYSGSPSLPVQGICPTGWHIPSYAEWNTLLGYLGANMHTKMLHGGTSGFDGLLTGYRCTMSGGYRTSAMEDPINWMTYYWVSEQTDAGNAPFFELSTTQISAMSFYKSVGLNVRCLSNTLIGVNENPGIRSFDLNGVRYSNQLEMDITSLNMLTFNYQVYNMGGQLILDGNYGLQKGSNLIRLNVVLEPGIYLLKLTNTEGMVTRKFVSQ